MFEVYLLSIYVYCIMLRSGNSQTKVKIDINSITDFQICQNTLRKSYTFSSLKVKYLSIRKNSHLMLIEILSKNRNKTRYMY